MSASTPLKSVLKTNGFSALIALYIVLLPFIHAGNIVDPSLVPRQMLLAVVTCACGVLIFLRQRQLTAPLSGAVAACMLLLAACYVASISQAMHRSDAFYIATKELLYACFFMACLMLFRNKQLNMVFISNAFLVFVFSSVALLVSEMAATFSGSDPVPAGQKLYQVSTAFGHKNLMSSVLFLGIPFCVVAFINGRKSMKVISIVALVLIACTILFLQTKAVIAAALFSGLVCLVVCAPLLRQARKTLLYPLVASVVLLIATAGFIAFTHPHRFALLLDNNTLKERLLLWDNSIQMAREYPLLGVGAGNWQIHFPKYGLEKFMQTNYRISDGYTTFQRPHNDFLWVLDETGVIGLACFATIFGLLFYYLVTLVRHCQGGRRTIFIALLFTICGYAFISFFDFPLERTEHTAIFLLLAAFITAGYGKPVAGKNLLPRVSLFLLITAGGVVNIITCTYRLSGERHSNRVINAHAMGNWQRMIREAPAAVNPFYDMDNLSIPVCWYSGVAKFSVGDAAGAEQDFEQAYRIHPYQVHVINNLASIHEQRGDHLRAISLYDELLKISPTQPDAILNKSGALFNAGKSEDAYQAILQFPHYDGDNQQFRTFFTAIAKAHLQALLQTEKDTIRAARYKSAMADDNRIISAFRECKEKNITFDSVIK